MAHYFHETFLTPTSPRPFTMLVGHDLNIYTLLTLLEANDYQLPEQLESVPYGGKVVFQRWVDNQNKQWIKTEYFYQSPDQIRQGLPFNMSTNPPKRFVLSFKGCTLNEKGMCSLAQFSQLVEKKLAP